MFSTRIFLTSVFSAAVALGQTSEGTGTLTVNGKAATLRYANALLTKDWTLGPNRKMVEVDVIKLALSDSPLEDVEDDFDLGARGKMGTLNGLRIVFSNKGELLSGNIYGKDFEHGTSPMFVSHVLFDRKILNDKTIAGKLRLDEPASGFGGPTYDFDITFSAALKREPKPTVEGDAAAETAPAKAVQAFLRAVTTKDVNALKKILRKEFADMLESPDGKESVMGLLEGSFPPDEVKQLKIIRVFDFGTRAWVEGTSKRPSRGGKASTDVTYRIRAVKAGAEWKVQPM